MPDISETVYLGRDNVIELILLADDVVVDLTPVTRVVLRDTRCHLLIDSAASAAFDWSGGDGLLQMTLGDETITPGTYTCEVILYDPSNLDGLVWEEQIELKVRKACS